MNYIKQKRFSLIASPALFIFLLIFHHFSYGQLLIDHTLTAEELVQNVLIGNGVIATNVTYSGAFDVAIGHFTNGNTTNIGMDEGIVLSSGSVDLIPDTAGTQLDPRIITLINWTPGDPDLDALPGVSNTNDASILEFDFVPQSDTIRFRYVFGSEEYPNLINYYNDVFAYFITGPNPSGPAYSKNNIALIPGTDLPVSVDNVNNGIANDGPCMNCEYYINNWGGFTIAFNGFTTVLTAEALVYPDSLYHMKLSIADEMDHSWDSGVFLEAFSFASVNTYIHTEFSSSSSSYGTFIEGCNNGTVFFNLNTPQPDDYVVQIDVLGTATEGIDYSMIPASLVIPAGATSDSIVIEAFQDNIFEPTETIILVLEYESLGNTVIDTLSFPLLDNNIDFGGLGALYCEDSSPVTLWGQPADGIYSGTGMIGNVFYPDQANEGLNQIFFTKYFIDNTGTTPDTVCTNQLFLETNVQLAATAYAGSSSTLCQGGIFDFSSLSILPDSSHCNSILWSTSGLGTISDPHVIYPVYTPEPNELGAIIFTLIAYGEDPCGNDTSQMTLTIQALPSVDAGPDGMSCDNSPFALSLASASAFNSILWSGSGDGMFNNQTIENPVYTPGVSDLAAGSVVLMLTATPVTPCVTNISDAMTLVFGTISNAGSDENICAGQFFDFATSTILPDTTNCDSLRWIGGVGTFDNTRLIHPVYTPEYNEFGLVQLALVAYGTPPCSNDTSYMTLYIEPFPYVDAGSDGMSCDNSPYNLSLALAMDYSSILWTSSGDGTFNNQSNENPVYTPGVADIVTGSVILTLTATPNAPCNNAVSDAMTLFLGTISNAGSNESTCADLSFDFATSTILPDTINCDSLRWIGGSGNFSDPKLLFPVYSPGNNETGLVQLDLVAYGTPPCSNDTSQMILTIQPLPTIDAGSNEVICETDNISLSAAVTHYTLLQWSTSGNGTFSDFNSISPTYFPGSIDLLSGQVTLKLSAVPIDPCLNIVMDSLTVTFERTPTAFAGIDTLFCMEGSITLSEADTTYASTLLWSNFSGDGTFDDATLLHPMYSPGINELQTGIVHLLLTAYAQGSCTESNTSEITFNVQPVPTSNAGADNVICKGDSYPLSGQVSQYSSFAWSTQGNGIFSDPSIENPIYTPGSVDLINDSVVLVLTAQPIAPCTDPVISSMTLRLQPPPIVNAGLSMDLICEGNSYSLAGTAEDFSLLRWSNNGGDGYFDHDDQLDAIYTPGSTDIANGSVQLTLTAYAQAPCTIEASSNLMLNIQSLCQVFAGNDTITCQDVYFNLSRLETPPTASNFDSIRWFTTGIGYFNDPRLIAPTYFPDQSEGLTENDTLTMTMVGYGLAPCGNDTSTMQLVVIPGASAHAGSDESTCFGMPYDFANSADSSFAMHHATLYWETSGSGHFVDPNVSRPIYIPGVNETGPVTLTMVAANIINCDSIDEMVLTIRPTYEIPVDITVCYYDSVFAQGSWQY
ncbi:MAG: choice-of-anchor L domain-containing protein, partial [Bacteroidales bacterium]|nr:choice-of-anchor L domain-containing protein [Bacteroidales bacterium]